MPSGKYVDRINSIQILRAAAAMGVVLAHLSVSFDIIFHEKDKIFNLFMGNTGVDLFFVISGFIMLYTSESLFAAQAGGRRFLRKRIIRIIPLYWLTTSYALWPMLKSTSFHPSLGLLKTIFGSYFFLPFPLGSTGGPILIVGWTLNYEMFFYLLFSLMLFANRLRAACLTTVAIFLCVLIGRLLDGHLSVFWVHFTNPLMLEFVMGLWIAIVYRADVRISPILSALLIAIGIVLIISSSSTGDQNIYRALTWGGGYALIVAAVALANTGAASALWRPVVLVGEASYAIYLTHWFVIMKPPHLLMAAAPALSSPIFYSISIVALAVAVGMATHFLVEKPIMRILAKWWAVPSFIQVPDRTVVPQPQIIPPAG